MPRFLDAGDHTDVGEFSCVIAQEEVGSADVVDFVGGETGFLECVVFREFRFDDELPAREFLHGWLFWPSILAVVAVGDDPNVEITIAIEIAKARHEAGIDLSQSEF